MAEGIKPNDLDELRDRPRRAGRCLNRATACTLYVLCALASACGRGGGPGHDGGNPGDASDDGGSGGGGRLLVDLSLGPEMLPDGVTLQTAQMGISELRARNDRGGEQEPVRDHVGLLDLLGTATVDLSPAPPATYGRLTAHLESGDWGPALELHFGGDDHALMVVDLHDTQIDARCNPVVTLLPGGELRMHLVLDASALYAAMQDVGLPDAQDGVVEVDDDTAPDAIAAVESRLPSAISLRCEMNNP